MCRNSAAPKERTGEQTAWKQLKRLGDCGKTMLCRGDLAQKETDTVTNVFLCEIPEGPANVWTDGAQLHEMSYVSNIFSGGGEALDCYTELCCVTRYCCDFVCDLQHPLEK